MSAQQNENTQRLPAASTQPTATEASAGDGSTASSGTQPDIDSDATVMNAPGTNSRLAALQAKQSALQAKLASLKDERARLATLTPLSSDHVPQGEQSDEERTAEALASSNALIKEHIALLHRYNEIKDVGQGLMGMIAERRGVRVVEVMREAGIGDKD